jgi:hypothetical protein
MQMPCALLAILNGEEEALVCLSDRQAATLGSIAVSLAARVNANRATDRLLLSLEKDAVANAMATAEFAERCAERSDTHSDSLTQLPAIGNTHTLMPIALSKPSIRKRASTEKCQSKAETAKAARLDRLRGRGSKLRRLIDRE